MTTDPESKPGDVASTVEQAKQLTVADSFDGSFEDLVMAVQLEHELAGFETIATPRIDEQIAGQLGEAVTRTALILVCHAEIGKEAIDLHPTIAGLFPCTTVVYESATDGTWHVYHASAMQAISDLGFFADSPEAMDDLVSMTAERMGDVWSEIESRFGAPESGS